MKPILCIGLAADPTFMHSVRALSAAGLRCIVLDLVHLVEDGAFSLDYNSPLYSMIRVGPLTINLGDVAGVLTRMVDFSEAAPDALREHRARDVFAAICQFLARLPLPIINPPFRDLGNFSKLPHGATIARELGWSTPATCVTNVPGIARQFISRAPGGVVVKGCSAAKTWVSLYQPGLDDDRLPLIRNCPIAVQHRIAGADVRVHVVGVRVFAESIVSAGVDYRVNKGNTYAPIEPPPSIRSGCIQLAATARCPLLGIDFKLTSDAQWYFLEANTLPCYEGYDHRAGLAISGAIAAWFAERVA